MKKKILIVEDENNLRQVLAESLTEKYDVEEAPDGEAAVTKILDKVPELIILDLLLPKLDGFKVLERLRHYPDQKISQIKVIIFSNLWSNKDILQARALKIDEYFVKAHTTVAEVVKRVEEIVGR